MKEAMTGIIGGRSDADDKTKIGLSGLREKLRGMSKDKLHAALSNGSVDAAVKKQIEKELDERANRGDAGRSDANHLEVRKIPNGGAKPWGVYSNRWGGWETICATEAEARAALKRLAAYYAEADKKPMTGFAMPRKDSASGAMTMKRSDLARVGAAIADLGQQVVKVENRFLDRQWAKGDIARADAIVNLGEPALMSDAARAICDAVPEQNKGPGYNQEAVQKSIESSKQKIGGKEAKMIHALLRGRGDDMGKLGQADTEDEEKGEDDEEETYLAARTAHTQSPSRDSKAALETAAYRLNSAKERAAQEREEALNVSETVGAGASDSKAKAKK